MDWLRIKLLFTVMSGKTNSCLHTTHVKSWLLVHKHMMLQESDRTGKSALQKHSDPVTETHQCFSFSGHKHNFHLTSGVR